MAKEIRKKVTVKMRPETFVVMEKLRYEKNTDFQAIGEVLFEAWSKGEIHVNPGIDPPISIGKHERKVPYPYRGVNRELHDKLEAVLNSGDQKTLSAVVPNIELFFDRLKPSARRAAG